MAEAAYALVGVLLALVVLRARPFVVLCLFATAIFLLPGPLLVPYTGANYLTYHHVLTLAGLARLVLGRVDGSVRRRDLTVTAPQVALLGLVLVAFVGGIVLAEAGPLGAASFRFVDLLDQLGYLTVVVVLARQVGGRAVLEAAAIGLLAGIVIATLEHLTGHSWGRLLFRPFPNGNGVSAAFPLAERGGSLRVRAGTEFALEFAWLVVALAPALVLVALRRGGVLAAGAVSVACVAVVYWSFTRTALVAVVVVIALTALLSRSKVLIAGAAVGAAAAGIAYETVPSVAAHLSTSTASGSVLVRGQRLAPAMEVASRHPFRGTGLGQLITSGFPTTDQAFLLEYVELGVVGVVALVVVLLAALHLCARAAFAQVDREVAVAGCLGALAFIASCFAYDAGTLVQGTHSLWFVVAGCAAVPLPRAAAPRPGRLLVGAGLAGAVGLLAGTLITAVAPSHTAVRAYFTTVPLQVEGQLTFDPVTNAGYLINTTCGAMTAASLPGVTVDCSDSFGAAGVGTLRIQAPTPFDLDVAVRTLTELARDTAGVRYLQVIPRDLPATGQDTWVRTAPVWVALAAAGLTALLWPAGPRPGPVPPPPASGIAPWPAVPARRRQPVPADR